MKSVNALLLVVLLPVAWACSSPEKLYRATDESSCTEKEGYWYKGKCWANFEGHDITVGNIDSVYEAQMKAAGQTYVSVNGEKHGLEFFLPQPEGNQMLVIASFDQLEKNLILSFKPKAPGKKDFTAEASYLSGNIINGPDDLEPKPIAGGSVQVSTTEAFEIQVDGSLVGLFGEPYNISLFGNESVMGMGTSTLEVHGIEAFLSGTLGTVTYGQVKNLLTNHPEVRTIVLDQVDGSVNDDVNLFTASLVREAGLNTKVLANSNIASGAVDFFAAGVERIVTRGARLGVHSWAGGEVKGDELPRDHPTHQYQLAYFTKMLGETNGPDFYFYTLEAAPAEDIYFMREDEIEKWNLATKFVE